jgi:DinB superfamily
MGPKDIIAKTLDTSDFILKKYLEDLSDADLKIRPVAGMNPIALQLGHLVGAERHFAEMVQPDSAPPLPPGFSEAHDLKKQRDDDSRFLTKDEYLKLYETQRAHLKDVLASVTESELSDTRGGKLPPFAPTVADVLNMAGVHSLGHSGQFIAVRRYLKKPIAF